ncbi:protein kinase [Streptomyces roseoverticillatus]|uniref:protein kinase n=1 Tax=Streptomyces roseoverticillatus TaxID=66429 RepID=UPI0027E3C49C|nr:protein kinase [Streptomyces roseoverticillatus]MCF3103466.1 protein kinase [Streptomyces roseoverticillatus]
MDDYAGRILAGRYRLPLPPSDVFELVETRAFDTLSGQEVLVRQIPLPEVVDAEVVDASGACPGQGAGSAAHGARRTGRGPADDPAVSRALAAATAAAQVPDHPRLDQVFHVFAEGGSLWVVSELVPARPLAALLAERPLSPHRAAEVAADVLTALRALHAHGWTHRNITTRTVLICDDGRAVLTGLAAGAAEEALCGYNPVPEGMDPPGGANGGAGANGGTGPNAGGGMPSPQRAARGAAGLSRTPGQPGGSASGGAAVGGRTPGGAPRGAGGGRPGPGSGHGLSSGLGSGSGLGPSSGLGAGPGSGFGGGFAPRGSAPDGSVPGGSAPGGQASPRAGGQGAAGPAPSPYRDQGAAGGFLPPGGPRASGETWPPLNSRPPAGGQGAGRPGRGQPGGQGAGPGAGQPGSQAGPRQVRSSAIVAYRAGAARAAAARAAGDDAPPATPTGSSTWGGGSASSGAAPTPTPWAAPGSPHGTPSGRNRPPGPPGARSGPAGPGNAARPDVPEVKLPGSTASWPAFPGLTAPPRSAAPGPAPAAPPGTRPGAGNGAAAHGAGNVAPPPPSSPSPRASQSPAKSPESRPSATVPVPGSGSAGMPPAAWGAAGRQPAGALAVERARQARMVVVGAVTERWAPEQAWPVQENWQLAPPVGPAADLWALGALLFRVVQGHAPYPEDSTAELVRLVCVEPPAFAEECGALRPVVESLMRKDPAERPEFEELRGWLRSLIRSAPEPEPGGRTLTVPDTAPDTPADQHRLPVVRRKGELVRRRRGRPITAVDTASAAHGRHKKTARDTARDRARGTTKDAAKGNAPAPRSATPRTGHLQEQRGRPARSAFGLGRLLLGLVLLLLIGASLYAMLFMPRAEDSAGQARADHTGSAGARSAAPRAPGATVTPGGAKAAGGADASGGATAEERIAESDGAAKGFTLRKDPKGFTVAVAKDWQRRGANDRGQVVYAGGEYQLVVVPGRDEVAEFGSDPMAYQQSKEPELEAYRSSSWSGASGLRRIDVGGTASAEGTFNWNDSSGRQVYVRNSATLVNGRYHLLQVIGPMNEQRSVDRFFEQAAATYRAGG